MLNINNIKGIQRVLGISVMLYSVVVLPITMISFIYENEVNLAFIKTSIMSFIIGASLWIPTIQYPKKLSGQETRIAVVLLWTTIIILGSLPFFLNLHPRISIANAVFESASAITTTGATILTELNSFPKDILFYRHLLQWFGGIGITVLSVHLMPLLGISGIQLDRSEVSSPIANIKPMPKISKIADSIWRIYLFLTISCAIIFYLAGMNLFDAINHSLSTLSIGGFSTHNNSMGYFQSDTIYMITIFFMAIAGINFSLHNMVWQRRNIGHYLTDEESRLYLTILTMMSLGTILYLYLSNSLNAPSITIYKAIFQSFSMETDTGFTMTDHEKWPKFLSALLMMSSCIGGCAGSTGGGMKIIRILILLKKLKNIISRLIPCCKITPIKVNGQTISPKIINEVWRYFALYCLCLFILSILLMVANLDLITSFSAVIACLNNLGPGLAMVNKNYYDINSIAKLILCLAMLLGRLDIVTFFAAFIPGFCKITETTTT